MFLVSDEQHEMRAGKGDAERVPTNNPQGLTGWVFETLRGLKSAGWDSQRRPHQRQMRVLETLAIGGKRQLQLVSCGDERFLVGSGPESVQTIVRVGPEPLATGSLGFTKEQGE
jgi:hypothetical protein